MISAANAAVLLSDRINARAGQPALPDASADPHTMTPAQIDKVSSDFESMFVSQMLDQMFGDSLGAEAFGDSESSEVYKGMMVEQYGKQIARSGGIGIASYVKQELLKLQEISHGRAA